MATTTTYSLIKPTVGGDENTWGQDLNDNFDSIDDLLDGTTAIAPNLTEGSWEVGGVAVTATAAELNYVDGVTSSIQAQLDAKQPLDAGLTSIAGLTTAADRMIYTTASDTYAVATITSAGRAILDDADAAAQQQTLGLLDEDDFASDSASFPPSQQSVGAYIESRHVGGAINTVSRAFATTYQNTRGRDIIVMPVLSSTLTAVISLQVSTDGSSWIPAFQQVVATPNQVAYAMVVPAGFYYRVTTSAGTGVVNAWREIY